MTERANVLAVLRQMQVNSGHFRGALPVLADHHEGEHERELAAIAAVAELIERMAKIDAICAAGETDPERMAAMLAEIAEIAYMEPQS